MRPRTPGGYRTRSNAVGGATMLVHEFAGALVHRIIDRGNARIPEHAHDWPVLSLFVLGGYSNRTEIGDRYMCGPSAVLYGAAARHANAVSADGFEQIEIQFDPAWLRFPALPRMPVSHLTGGAVGLATRELARVCGEAMEEARVAAALRRYLTLALGRPAGNHPAWVEYVSGRLRQDTTLRVDDLARELDLHPSWVGSAYRQALGESILETTTRLRVERAARLLRETDLSCCRIANDAGFCDQSHMNRSFRRVLARTPSTVRTERSEFREADAG